MKEQREKPPSAESSWLDRHPSIAPLAAGTALLAFAHGAFALWLHASTDANLAWSLARLGVMVGVVTALLLIPVLLLARRWLAAWREGDAGRATLQASLFMVVGLTSWMAADKVFTDLDLGLGGPVLAAVLATAIGVAATAWLSLPARVVRAGLVALPVLIVLVLLPFGPGSAPPGPGGTGGDGAADEESRIPRLRPLEGADASPPDVILISIDTLRADRLGVYGQEPTLTPQMDRLAAEGTLFERTLAASPWTVPSIASMMTGLPSSRHGAGLTFSAGLTFKRSPLDSEHTTVAERFATAGYRTRAVIANPFIISLGMAQGFEEAENVIQKVVGLGLGQDFPLIRVVRALLPPSGDYRAQALTDWALERLDSEEPLFLWVHYIDPHIPYQADPTHLDVDAWTNAAMRKSSLETREDGTVVGEVFTAVEKVRSGMTWLTEEDRKRLGEYYDRAVAYVDGEVGRLVDALRERSKDRGVVVVLTSDHGEELWDHGDFEHGHDYYREVTQVPLIFWGEGVPAGQRVGEVVGLVDIAPTLVELAGFQGHPAENVDEGRSLVPLIRQLPAEDGGGESGELAEGVDEAADSEVASDESIIYGPPRFSGGNLYGLPAVMVEEGPWRFILRANGVTELYDVTVDPGERNNIASQHPELEAKYRQLLEPRLAVFLAGKGGQSGDLSPETLEALRSLGYVQ